MLGLLQLLYSAQARELALTYSESTVAPPGGSRELQSFRSTAMMWAAACPSPAGAQVALEVAARIATR